MLMITYYRCIHTNANSLLKRQSTLNQVIQNNLENMQNKMIKTMVFMSKIKILQ